MAVMHAASARRCAASARLRCLVASTADIWNQKNLEPGPEHSLHSCAARELAPLACPVWRAAAFVREMRLPQLLQKPKDASSCGEAVCVEPLQTRARCSSGVKRHMPASALVCRGAPGRSTLPAPLGEEVDQQSHQHRPVDHQHWNYIPAHTGKAWLRRSDIKRGRMRTSAATRSLSRKALQRDGNPACQAQPLQSTVHQAGAH